MDNKKVASELVKLAKELMALDEKYQKPDGTFKKMTPVEGDGKKSKFNGCVRSMMAQGHSQESAEKICASIARAKGKA